MIDEMSMLETAQDFLAQGISCIPVTLEDKRPLGQWKSYQSHAMSLDVAGRKFSGLNGRHGIALICGKVSGGLEVLDFDNKFGNIEEVFKAFILDPDVNAIVFGSKQVPYEKTPSGGYHLWYRCERVDGNQKLAQNYGEDKKQKITVIETRGEGGYCLCAPSKNYVLKYGSLSAIPTITPAERSILLDRARAFDRVHESASPTAAASAPTHTGASPSSVGGGFTPVRIGTDADTRPGDAYNDDPKSGDETLQLLYDHGWTYSHADAVNKYLVRPGKDKKDGHSASFNGKLLNVFSSNAAPFEGGKAYSPYQVLGLLKHRGDWGAAAKELAERGFGKKSEPSTRPIPMTIRPEDPQDGFIISKMNKQGEIIGYELDYDRYIEILNEAGFRIYAVEKDERLVRIEDNIVSEVTLRHVITFSRDLVDDSDVRNYLYKNETKLFTMGKMMLLKTLPDRFNVADSETAWLYFRNGAVRVRRGCDEYAMFEYSELEYPVWRDQIMDRDFDPAALGSRDSEIERFIFNVSAQRNDRLQLMMSVIGYLLHDFKQMSKTKAVIFTDERIPENEDDANGGSGKSILAKFIRMYRSTEMMGGKSVDFQDKFIYQNVSYDTGLVMFDDVGRKFPFANLFEVITGDLKVERKNMPPFVIPFERAPKFLITTNYTIQGTGDSYDRRKLEIEFSPYYNTERTPRSEFGHDLMTEWTPEEQARADAFAIECLKFYLDNDLLSNENTQTTARIRQCMSECGRDFVEFMFEEIETGKIQHNQEFDRKESFARFKDSVEDCEEKFAGFTKKITKFAMIFRLRISNRKGAATRYTRLNGDMQKILRNYKAHMQ